MPNELFLRSLIGPEYGRIDGLLLDDHENAEVSPCTLADLPQHLLKPLLRHETRSSIRLSIIRAPKVYQR